MSGITCFTVHYKIVVSSTTRSNLLGVHLNGYCINQSINQSNLSPLIIVSLCHSYMYIIQLYVITICGILKIFQFPSPIEINFHNITEILLKVPLNTHTIYSTHTCITILLQHTLTHYHMFRKKYGEAPSVSFKP